MADIRQADNESSDSELSEGWDVVAQVDVCAADISSDGESVEVLEHEEADNIRLEEMDVIQAESTTGTNETSNFDDSDPFEELPLPVNGEFSEEEENLVSDIVPFSPGISYFLLFF